jgi:low temperature requirement protein LtrA
MSTESRARGSEDHRITPLELFFDLAMVFAFTQVTRLLADDPSWGGVLRGMLVLAALWWAWNGYAWLSSSTDVDEGGIRLAMLASTGTMLVVGVAVPDAFGDDAVLFGVAYLVVRLLHLLLSALVARGDPDSRGAFCGSLRLRSSVPRCSWSRASLRLDASRCGVSGYRSITSDRSWSASGAAGASPRSTSRSGSD